MSVDLQQCFSSMRKAHLSNSNPELEIRLDRLTRLEQVFSKYQDEFVKAISDDFSNRPAHETQAFDIIPTLAEMSIARKNLRRWMKTKRAKTPLYLQPARAMLKPQPLGVVGIISPWNFPLNLSLVPAVAALAAGCRVMLKPSELTPKTSRLLTKVIAEALAQEEMCVIEGGADTAAAFSALPFAHLLFTGSTDVGRKVAVAAANNLTPVTLELGGKSPAIVMPSADLKQAARRIAWGKLSNGGQVCVAPDYALVPRAKMNEFVVLIKQWSESFYPKGAQDEDYSHIISERHCDRLKALVEESRAAGDNVVSAMKSNEGNSRAFPLTLVVDPAVDSSVMQQEIFGPILPIVPYDDPEEALAFVTSRDHPLALYVFAQDKDEQTMWLDNSIAGGVTVNDTIIHVGFDTLPFGGVGASGYGGYHGVDGFKTFSHLKPIVLQSRWNATRVFESPMSDLKAQLIAFVKRIL